MAVYIGRIGSPFAVSLVLAVFFFGQMVFAPVWGAIADVTGRRRGVLVASSTLATLSILPLAVVDGIVAPLAFRTLFAIFVAGFLPVMFTIMNEHGGATDRGAAVGLFGSAAAAGSVFGRGASGPMIDWLTPSSVYLFLAGLGGLVAILCLFIADPTPTPDADGPAFGDRLRQRLLPGVGEGTAHLRVNGLHWLYVASFLRNATVIGIASLLPVYFVSELGLAAVTMGVILGINPATQVIGMYSFGKLSDGTGRKGLITGGLAGSGLSALVVAGASIFPALRVRAVVASLGMIVLGLAFSGLQTGSVTFIGDVAPTDRESELIGLRSTARGLGGVVGPPLLGVGATVIGYEATFVAASLLAFAAAALVVRNLVESHGPSAPAASGD
ncbi:MFS transporter [haloarchaeon 3A1-DGR]|nr:MFS transporter [haloarchaeon 3A1-DGR]